MKTQQFWLLTFAMFFSNAVLFAQKVKQGNFIEKIGQFKLHYTVKGKGPVMIAGHTNSGKIGYELTLKPLEEMFTMVYYEPRGTGLSDVPKNIDDYNNDSWVEELEQLRKKLGIKNIWLFGHSDQSAIAMLYALKYPQNTNGLILTGTSLINNQEESNKRRYRSEKMRSDTCVWFAQVLEDWNYSIQYQTDTNAVGENIKYAPIKWWCYSESSAQKVIPIVEEINKRGRRKPVNGVRYMESATERNNYLEKQKLFYKIECPTLIVNGLYDTNNTPEFAKALQLSLSNAQLVLIDKAGHFPWVENPEPSFEAITKWLNSMY